MRIIQTIYVRSAGEGWEVHGEGGPIYRTVAEDDALSFGLDLAKAQAPSRLVMRRSNGEQLVREFETADWPPERVRADAFSGAHGSRAHEGVFHFEAPGARPRVERWTVTIR